jgi:hypothetical protein
MDTRTQPLDWLPSGRDIAMRPAAQAWDAIRVPAHIAQRALNMLGDASGAVICDPWSSAVYWLVPVGIAATWEMRETRALGESQYVGVPSTAHRTRPGPHWLIPPTEDRCHTDPQLLRAALLAAIGAELGPREADQ